MIAIRDAWGEKRVIPNSDSPELGTTFDTRGKTMKKVLLATTALTLSAGVAYAEVSLSGSARMGLVYTGAVAGSAADAGTALVGATGSAITAGTAAAALNTEVAGTLAGTDTTAALQIAAIRAKRTSVADARDLAIAQGAALSVVDGFDTDLEALDDAIEAIGAAAEVDDTAATTRMEYRTRISLTGSGETDSGLAYSATIRLQDSSTAASVQAIGVTVSGAFGSLTFGSSSSAAEYAVGDIAGVGYTGLGGTNETSFLTGSFAMYSYTAGNVTVYASAGQIDSDDMSFGASFSSNGMTVGAGYESNGDDETATSASASYAMGDTTIKAVYMDSDADGEETGVSVASKMGNVSVAAFYKSTDDADHYGVGASVDIGGASLTGGIVDTDGQTRADLGMTFKF
jgi:outer membrane protein OmpU